MPSHYCHTLTHVQDKRRPSTSRNTCDSALALLPNCVVYAACVACSLPSVSAHMLSACRCTPTPRHRLRVCCCYTRACHVSNCCFKEKASTTTPSISTLYVCMLVLWDALTRLQPPTQVVSADIGSGVCMPAASCYAHMCVEYHDAQYFPMV